MANLTQRAAQKLLDDIRSAKVSAHAIAHRTGLPGAVDAAFVGGLESVLQSFLRSQGCFDAAAALPGVMNRQPSDAEIAERNAQIDGYRRKPEGAAHG